jgi:hypothetical protein
MKYGLFILMMTIAGQASAASCDGDLIDFGNGKIGYRLKNALCTEENNFCHTGQGPVTAKDNFWGYQRECDFCDYMTNYCATGKSYGIVENYSGSVYKGEIFDRNRPSTDFACLQKYEKKTPGVVLVYRGKAGYFNGLNHFDHGFYSPCYCTYENYYCGTPMNPNPSFGAEDLKAQLERSQH